MKLVNDLIGILTCAIRVWNTPWWSPTRADLHETNSESDVSAAGVDTRRMVTVRHMFRSVLGSLTLLSGLAVPDWVSAASDPLTDRPPSLQLRLQPAEPGIRFPPLAQSDLSSLPHPDQGEGPTGVRRSLSGALPERGLGTIPGSWLETTVGSVWRLQMASPDAVALRVHIQNAVLGDGHL